MGNPEKPEIQGTGIPPVEEKFRAFLTGEERILNDIAGGAGFTFKRGEGRALREQAGERSDAKHAALAAVNPPGARAGE